MTRQIAILLATALLASPTAAAAQDSSSITLSGEVPKTCVIGQPTTVTLNLNDMTGADGRITAVLAGAAASASTTIDNAWCNTPSVLSLNADPLALSQTPPYATPAGFARLVTYDATLSGWPAALVDRPFVGDTAKTTSALSPHAAQLTLEISMLEALSASGEAANPLAVLEAGSYSGSVTVSVAANP